MKICLRKSYSTSLSLSVGTVSNAPDLFFSSFPAPLLRVVSPVRQVDPPRPVPIASTDDDQFEFDFGYNDNDFFAASSSVCSPAPSARASSRASSSPVCSPVPVSRTSSVGAAASRASSARAPASPASPARTSSRAPSSRAPSSRASSSRASSSRAPSALSAPAPASSAPVDDYNFAMIPSLVNVLSTLHEDSQYDGVSSVATPLPTAVDADADSVETDGKYRII